jgi:hypothetical protein
VASCQIRLSQLLSRPKTCGMSKSRGGTTTLMEAVSAARRPRASECLTQAKVVHARDNLRHHLEVQIQHLIDTVPRRHAGITRCLPRFRPLSSREMQHGPRHEKLHCDAPQTHGSCQTFTQHNTQARVNEAEGCDMLRT